MTLFRLVKVSRQDLRFSRGAIIPNESTRVCLLRKAVSRFALGKLKSLCSTRDKIFCVDNVLSELSSPATLCVLESVLLSVHILLENGPAVNG